MNTPARSAWILRALILSITAALLIMALTKTSWAMPLEPDNDPRSPTRPTATVIVQSDADDGTAVPANCPGASCRLRDAIAYASPDDTITFAGDYTITLASELTIDKNVTIDGAGHSVTASGNYVVRVFSVNAGVIFNLLNLTVANGNCCGTPSNGGGLYKVDPCVKTPKVLFLKCISPLCEMVLTGS